MICEYCNTIHPKSQEYNTYYCIARLMEQADRQAEDIKRYRMSLECVMANCINPAHTMTTLGLEETVDACSEIAQSALKGTDDADTISDGFGSTWSKTCAMCGKKTMEIVRPGKVQCGECG